MGTALRDQLLKLGLVDEKRVREAEKEKRDQKKKQPRREAPVSSEQQRRAKQLQVEKAASDRELNEQQKRKAERKALDAQMMQLIENGRRPKNDGEHAFNFIDGNKVKRLYVAEATRDQLSCGKLGIVRLKNRYEIVTAEIADAIAARAPGYLIVLNRAHAKGAEEQADADHPIPDDLRW